MGHFVAVPSAAADPPNANTRFLAQLVEAFYPTGIGDPKALDQETLNLSDQLVLV